MRLSTLSTEYVRVPVDALEAGVQVDFTSDALEFAIVAVGVEPVAGDWRSGSWEIDGNDIYARILVGPGAAAPLAQGQYDVWVRIHDNPETPVRRSGPLFIDP